MPTRIDIAASKGGADLVLVEDNGTGMDADDLRLAVERHATSKLPVQDGTDDLSNIATLGFRGEALPSIGAVARLTITSRTATSDAYEIGGRWRCARTCAGRISCRRESVTRVDVRDCSYATPARLKFLKATLRRSCDDRCREAARDGASGCRLYLDLGWPSRA